MTAEEMCNRCKEFGPNGLTPFPCRRVPSRKCPFFDKIPDKQYAKIIKERVSRLKPKEERDLFDENVDSRAKDYLSNHSLRIK